MITRLHPRAATTVMAVVLAAATGSLASATPGVTLLGNVAAFMYDRNNNFGWRFTPTADIDISALGFFDASSRPGGGGTGLAQSHDIGIFRVADQSLMASVTVPAGVLGSLAANYRYNSLATPVRLSGGVTYLIAAFVLSASPDAMPGVSNWALAPSIIYANIPTPTPQNPLGGTGQYVTNAHGSPPDALGYAGLALTGTLPVFAANFQFSTARVPGDLNCDGIVSFDDIDPLILALSDPAAYATAYPNCNVLNGDCNGDGLVDFDDINPFVALLSGG